MKSIKLMASMLAVSLIVSGLALVSVGSDSNEIIINEAGGSVIEYGSIPGYEPHSVPRISLAEDYTCWDCAPCASHNPAWTAAIQAVGYDTIAPAYVHVWWPYDADDPFYVNCIDDVTDKLGGCSWVDRQERTSRS